MSAFKVWECQICNWIYDEAKGDPEEGLAPGTRWQDIPDDWCCPECGVGKDDFEMLQISAAKEPSKFEKPALQTDIAQTANAAVSEPLIIIGSGLAGYGLVKEIRRIDKSLPLVIYTGDDGGFYSKPSLSMGFSDNKSASDLVMESAEVMARRFDVEINVFTKVTQVDTRNKNIYLDNGGVRRYQQLVFATGSGCIRPPLKGDALGKVHHVNNLQDYTRFRTVLKSHSRVLILGAGLIGCEYADDLTRAGHGITIVDPQSGLLAGLLPPEASEVLTSNMQQAGIQCRFGVVVERVEQEPDGVRAVLSDGTSVSADIILSAVGVRPNITLAQQAGIACHRGIQVARNLQTSASKVYAVGDCAEVNGKVLVYIAPLNAQVKALAKNLCGGNTEVSYGVMPVVVKTKLHPVNVNPPHNHSGHWHVDVHRSSGVKARFIDTQGRLAGYAVTGDQLLEVAQLQRQCLPLLP